jgi:hypothetical protein
MYSFLQNLSALHKLFRTGLGVEAQKTMPFPLRRKAHMLQHSVDQKIKIWGSPKRFWCYRDESFIGAVKGIAQKSYHPLTLEYRVMEKLMILAGLDDEP